MLHSSDPQDSLQIRASLANQAGRSAQNVLRRYDRKPKRLASHRLYMSGLPRLRPALAYRLLLQLGSVERVVTADEAHIDASPRAGSHESLSHKRTRPLTASTLKGCAPDRGEWPDGTDHSTLNEGPARPRASRVGGWNEDLRRDRCAQSGHISVIPRSKMTANRQRRARAAKLMDINH